MPVSKRAQIVSLTKVKKKGRGAKERQVQEIRAAADEYRFGYVVSVANMRNNLLKEIRDEWSHSKLFFGKNRIMKLALGRSEAEQYRPGLFKLSEQIEGECGLLFTNLDSTAVLDYFSKLKVPAFARSGNEAMKAFSLPEGELPGIPFSMEEHLRSLGVPSQLKDGKVLCTREYQVCAEGEQLSPEQCRILELFQQKMSLFEVLVHCCWSRDDGSCEVFEIEYDSDDSEEKKN
ncbi:MAG: hypothetical protein MHM6MM_000041 [Cercozoa sp. M6MM]